MNPKKWVLVTDGGLGQGRSTLAAVRAVAAAGYLPAATSAVGGLPSLAAASRYCRRTVRVPAVSDPGFAAAIRAEVQSRSYLTVLPATDSALLALDVPVGHLLDKVQLAQRATAVDLRSPPLRVFPNSTALWDVASTLDYPVVVKPTESRFPSRRVNSPVELRRPMPDDGPILVQPYLSGTMRAVAGVVWQGRVVAVVHQRYLRTWPVECGGACAAESAPADLDVEARLARLLKGYDGIFMAQFADGYLLDLNARVYGSLTLAVTAGVNLVGIYCDLLSGYPAPARPLRARTGVFYRSFEHDIRHVAAVFGRNGHGFGWAVRALRPRRGAAHGVERLTDPLPMLARIRYIARRRQMNGARGGCQN